MQSDSEHGEKPGANAPRSWSQAILNEIKNRPFAYSVMAVALVMGPVLIKMIFPEVTTLQAIVGGLAFGVYAALSAVPQKFM